MSCEKFTNWAGDKGIHIPSSALTLAKIKEGEHLDFHVDDDVIVTMKHQMTAMELIHSIHALTTLSGKLLDYLIETCPRCEQCCGETCPYDEDDEDDNLPDLLREDNLDEAEHHDIYDVPEEMLSLLRSAGVCPGALEDRLMSDAIIYG